MYVSGSRATRRSSALFAAALGSASVILLVAASTVEPSRGRAQEMFAGYDTFCGLPVIVGSDPQLASARRFADGRPYLHVDPGVAANWSASTMFTVAHECAHHLLGHTTAMGTVQRYRGGTRQQELAADCWAAATLRRHGLVSDLNRTLFERASQGHFPPGQGYPSGAERAQAILTCAGASPRPPTPAPARECRTVIEECAHPAHGVDRVPCSHYGRLHQGDTVPCSHPCGMFPCHQFDIVPCSHIAQLHAFDTSPCTHRAHPSGHPRTICP